MLFRSNGDNVLATVLALVDEDGNEMESCPHPQQVFYVKLSETPDEFDILRDVYKRQALKEKGYNPVNQIVGYIMSGDPTYITSHNNARRYGTLVFCHI